MNNPINDIPVYTPPLAPPSTGGLADLFRFWLQGQINAAVAGHASRIERLEERLQTQDAAIKALAKHVQAMLVPQTMCADDLLEKLRNAEEWLEVLTGDVLNSSAFTEAVNETVFDRTFDEKIKDCINDLRFEVTVR